MKIFKCDFCNQIIECNKITINDKLYDICKQCKQSLDEKLDDKGEPKQAVVCNQPFTIYCYQYWCVQCGVYHPYPHYHFNYSTPYTPFVSPTVTYTIWNSDNTITANSTYGDNTNTFYLSSSGYSNIT